MALGSSKLQRYYAIIEVDGRGLADLLARAYALARRVEPTA